MTNEEFTILCQNLDKHVHSLLFSKAKEYATEDRLFNFRQATSILGTNPARVALMYQTKHYASLAKITQELDQGVRPSPALIREKVGDLIAYSYLIYACLMEQAEKEPSVQA